MVDLNLIDDIDEKIDSDQDQENQEPIDIDALEEEIAKDRDSLVGQQELVESNQVKLKNPHMEIKDGGSYLSIDFEGIFEQKGLDVYHDFDLRAKRNFKNIAGLIGNTYSDIFFDENFNLKKGMDILFFNLLNIKYKLMTEDIYYSDFIEILDAFIESYDKRLLKAIEEHVKQNYTLILDAVTEDSKRKNKKVNTQLQLTDDHGVIIAQVACLFRILIPLVSEFFVYNKKNFPKNDTEDASDDFEDVRFEQANLEIFDHYFDMMAEDKSKAVKNKLFKLVSSRISKTIYSDRRFWGVAKSHGITKQSESVSIYKKIMTIAIPKLVVQQDINVVSFLQAIINNQIDFLLQNKFKFKAEIIDDARHSRFSDDDDDVSEYDQIEAMMLRKDDGLFALRTISIQETLGRIRDAFNVEVTQDELRSVIKTFHKHEIQEQIVSFMTYKFFNDKSAVKFMTFNQYCLLVMYCKKYLTAHKFVILPKMLTAKCEKHRLRVNIIGKKTLPMIIESKKYNTLFRLKYEHYTKEIEKPLTTLIASSYSSTFKNEIDGSELFDSATKIGRIAEEFLDLAYLI